MNKNDSERIEALFRSLKMQKTNDEKKADVILMNSCSVRQSAEDRIFGFANKFFEEKKDFPNRIIAVTGCMPGRDKHNTFFKKMKGVDLYFATKDIINLPRWLSELNPNIVNMESLEDHYLSLRPFMEKKFQAFLTIQTGCNHFCTYCVVPYARGLEVNRPLKEILEEAKDLALHGAVEITLLGQIVNHYVAPDPEHFSSQNPYKKSDFAKLLFELNNISGIERIHYTAAHPIFMTEEVIDVLTLPKQVNYLHLPVQSGNNEILKKMNRRHTREFYVKTIEDIRAKKPDIALGTDIIVGFCGETEEQFLDTVSLFEACSFDISYHAKYSTRSGTLAEKIFEDTVSNEEKDNRWRILQSIMEKTVLEKNQKYLNMVVKVLVEKSDGIWSEGNSLEMKRVRFKGGKEMIGKVVLVEVYKAEVWMLYGRSRLD